MKDFSPSLSCPLSHSQVRPAMLSTEINKQDYSLAEITLLYLRHYCTNESAKVLKSSIKSFAKDSPQNRITDYKRGWNNATKNFLSIVEKILKQLEEQSSQTTPLDSQSALSTRSVPSTRLRSRSPKRSAPNENIFENAHSKHTDSKQAHDK